MKAIAVFPGKADTVHLADLQKPSINDVPDGRGVLVRVLRVGVDGTDKEINAAEYGAAPNGYDGLQAMTLGTASRPQLPPTSTRSHQAQQSHEGQFSTWSRHVLHLRRRSPRSGSP